MTEGRRALLSLLQRMTARAIAARLRVSPSTVSRWASGTHRPSARTKKKLAEINHGLTLRFSAFPR